MSSGLNLLLSDARGVYIPRDFVECFAIGDESGSWNGISQADAEILAAGPDHEQYWDAWMDVLDNTKLTDASGNVWTLHQDGDLWAICPALMDNDEYQSFFGESREEE